MREYYVPRVSLQDSCCQLRPLWTFWVLTAQPSAQGWQVFQKFSVPPVTETRTKDPECCVGLTGFGPLNFQILAPAEIWGFGLRAWGSSEVSRQEIVWLAELDIDAVIIIASRHHRELWGKGDLAPTILLYYYTTVLLYYYTTILLYYTTTILLLYYYCTTTILLLYY